MALLNAPNTVTLLRFAGIPPMVWLTYSRRPAGLVGAAALFALAVASDWLDGYLARKADARTAFGAFVDPLVDKVMILSLLFVFADRELVPVWLVLVLMAREFAVTAVRHTVSAAGRPVGANWMGKAKFCLQAGFIGLCYAYLIAEASGGRLPGGTALPFWALLGITLASLGFLWRFIALHRRSLGLPGG